MDLKKVPFRYRRNVRKLLKVYKSSDIENLEEFLRYQYVGMSDGWIKTNNATYQALLYLIKENKKTNDCVAGD